MAKLAVFICMPKRNTTHCPLSAEVPGRFPGAWEELDPHGWVGSLTRTPFSRASCSRVMGINEPMSDR